MTRHLRALIVIGAVLALAVSGTAAGASEDEGAAASVTAKVSGKVKVFAATSLPAAFTQIAKDFKKQNPDASVKFKYQASGDLAEQIADGAAADVFAPADEDAMNEVSDKINGSATPFAGNQLEIAVQEGNPKGIQTLADLARADVSVVLCSAETGCGQYTDEALAKANVQVTPLGREPDVAAVLKPVQDGEVDAAIVYVTDVKSAEKVTGVEIPADQNVVATYPIAVLKGAKNTKAAKAFVAYVLSRRGQATLSQFGFLAP